MYLFIHLLAHVSNKSRQDPCSHGSFMTTASLYNYWRWYRKLIKFLSFDMWYILYDQNKQRKKQTWNGNRGDFGLGILRKFMYWFGYNLTLQWEIVVSPRIDSSLSLHTITLHPIAPYTEPSIASHLILSYSSPPHLSCPIPSVSFHSIPFYPIPSMFS